MKIGLFSILSIALGLAMDSFSISVCKGLSLKRLSVSPCLIAGCWFGGFQALMTLVGWLLGSSFERLIESVDHWIAFGLLMLIGVNMVREAVADMREDACGGSCEREENPMRVSSMLGFAFATSIDAMAVGVTFSFAEVNILLACLIIGLVAFVCSAAGIVIGSLFGQRFRGRAELVGGVILMLLGTQILLRDLGLL